MKSVLDIPDSPYSIEYDGDLNWTLCETTPAHEGKDGKSIAARTRHLSYHATPGDALRACVRLLATVSERESILEWLDRLNAVNTRINATAKKLTYIKKNKKGKAK